ncbi:hypothetical protein [Sphingobium tyrosinilyticum]|uniref:Phage tail protein n=1 Tax=Sphingobium tyrosinilyticum TaxID=2715436 RepID=A0ABV9EVR5_9SPHN
MPLTLLVTNAGRAALVNAANTGTAPVTIAQVGLTATALVPAPEAVALPGEFKRLATISGDVVADDTIHLIIRDESSDVFTVRSLALYLGDGTLFGIYGQADILIEKSAQAMMLLAIDVQFADVDADTLAFGDTNFLNPPATTSVQGVVELATEAEAETGTDAVRAVTPKGLKTAVTSWLNARFGEGAPSAFVKSLLTVASVGAMRLALELKSAALKDEGAGNGLDADLLDGQHGSYYANVPARLGYTPWGPSNDGAGSGLDADLLDGQDSAYFTNIAARLGFTPVRQGGGTGQLTNVVYIGWSGSRVKVQVDASDMGNLVFDGNIADVWRSSNDGAGSGLDADLLDGQQGSYYTNITARLGYTPANKAGDTFTGRVYLDAQASGASGVANASGGLGEAEVKGNGTGAAMLAFHRPGAFAAYFGIDTDNKWKVGGWSMGAAAYPIWHSGNDGAGSGLDADLLDGQDSSYYTNIAARLGYTPWHAGNDGSGSGLDADLVDGWHRDSIRDWNNLLNKPFNWSGQAGQPSWLWGSNDGNNYYVWNPSNFNVNYANSAGWANSAGYADSAGKLSTASGSAPSYSARAWVNFNGVGAVSIRGAGNVSSITDNGVGNYSVNFSTAMPDGNYAAVGIVSAYSTRWDAHLVVPANSGVLPTTYCQVLTSYGGFDSVDLSYVSLVIHR